MPSESNAQNPELFEAKLAGTRREFRAALVSTFEELRVLLRSHKGDIDPHVGGDFAGDYMDLARFQALIPPARDDSGDDPRLEQAMSVLGELIERGDELFRVQVPAGADLAAAIKRAYAEIGRAFAAARTASCAQAGLPGVEEEAANLQAWPFSRWSKAERELTPGLLVQLRGEDLCADACLEFLDGSTVLGFLVEGQVSPVPLVGLVRPGIFVAQLDEAEELDAGLLVCGPAAIAIMPDASRATARFQHRPAGPGESGTGIGSRLAIQSLPESVPTGGFGPKSARQMTEELRHLAALAIEPAGGAASPAPVVRADRSPAEVAAEETTAASDDPIDQLAAWLLGHRKE